MRSTAGSLSSVLRLIVGTPATSAVFVVETSTEVLYQGVVTSGSPMIVNVSTELQVTETDFSNREKGIHIYSNGTKPIFVLVETIFSLNYATYLAYPCQAVESLTSYEYFIISQDDPLDFFRSTFLLVGAKDNTSVTIVPSQVVTLPVDTQISLSSIVSVNPNTQSHQFTLNKMQTLLVSSVDDLTGTRVTSDKPLTVISGHECANVPSTVSGCEPLALQVPPAATWGTKFLLAPFAGRNSAQVFKAVTSEDNTSFIYTCENTTSVVPVTSISLQFNTDKYCYLESSKPVLLAQLSVGQTVDSLGDPAIAMISPIDQYVHEIEFISLPTADFPSSYISIAVPAEHFNSFSVLFDGEVVNCQWQAIYNESGITVGYGCSMTVSSGESIPSQHTVSHSNPDGLLSVLVYGFNTFPYHGYAYLAGQIVFSGELPTDLISMTLSIFSNYS